MDASNRFLKEFSAPDPLLQRKQQDEVSHLLQYLYHDERRVIACRSQLGQQTHYGIEEIPLSYNEVARRLHLTRERVKTPEEQALRKMRHWAELPRFGKGE